MGKGLKKAEWWLQPWRESSRSRTAKGKCWPRLNPTSSLSQRTRVLLLLHPEPTEAWSCQGSPWVMKPPKQEKDPIMRVQRPGVTCRFDSAHGSQDWTPTTRTQHLYVLLSYSNFDILLFSLATAI